MKLVTLDQAKAQVKVDTTDGDTELSDMIEDASDAVVNYLGAAADVFINTANTDTAGDPIEVPRYAIRATLILLGYYYRNRDSDKDKAYLPGYLPPAVTAQLFPYRPPTIA